MGHDAVRTVMRVSCRAVPVECRRAQAEIRLLGRALFDGCTQAVHRGLWVTVIGHAQQTGVAFLIVLSTVPLGDGHTLSSFH